MDHGNGACCAPSAGRDSVPAARSEGGFEVAANGSRDGMVRLGGSFLMGTRDRDQVSGDGEGPVREVHVSDFYVDVEAVTNADYRRFVDATGYVTEAERFGWSFVFHHFVSAEVVGNVDQAVAAAPWWWRVDDAAWHSPEGPGSGIDDRLEHPVVHVSWADASAHAAWAGKRLPTEARVGARRPRRPTPETVPLGRHADARRPPQVQRPGRASSRTPTPPGTATSAPPRSTRSSQTPSGSTTRPATSGSGAPTGSAPSTRAARSMTPRARPRATPKSPRAGRTCATPRTATATASPPERRRPRTAPPATWASAWRWTPARP